ncbi:Cystathionine beta-synthase-like protein [Manis javanica]|nr:Cystathionine beta-synthase-like protein [Manis javanica]
MGSAIMWLLGSWHFQSSNTNCPQQAQAHCPQGTQTGLQRGAGEAREPLWPRPQTESFAGCLPQQPFLETKGVQQGEDPLNPRGLWFVYGFHF